jgi:hypothetical protein
MGLHVEHELLTIPGESGFTQVFSGVRVARFLIFCVKFCRSLFILWPLGCLSFDLLFLITL